MALRQTFQADPQGVYFQVNADGSISPYVPTEVPAFQVRPPVVPVLSPGVSGERSLDLHSADGVRDDARRPVHNAAQSKLGQSRRLHRR